MTEKLLKIALFFLVPYLASGQSRISGRVTDNKNKPLAEASVFLDHTLDGTTTDSAGSFSFTTNEKGGQMLVVSFLGEKKDSLALTVNGDIGNLHLTVAISKYLNTVTISAGSFQVSNDKKTALKPMDIMSTAGAGSDISKAIETLPGVQQPGAQTGLFVRGGDANETAILMDGMIVQNAFFSSLPGVSQSTRFSPFQFKGIAFSSGGYKARFGQALSSVLELNTTDLDEKDQISLGANMTGIYTSGDKVSGNSSMGFASYYNDLRIFYGLAASNVKFYNPPQGYGLSLRYASKPNKSGILKIYASDAGYQAGLVTPDPFIINDSVNFHLRSNTLLTSISYKQILKDKWSLFTSASYSYNKEDAGWTGTNLGSIPITDKDYRLQYRLEATRYLGSVTTVLAGAEIQRYGFRKGFDSLSGNFAETLVAGYIETNFTPLYWLVFRPGIRYEYSELLKQNAVEPRLSLAAKLSEHAQLSFAGGTFFEDPNSRYLLSGYRPKLEEAIHYIADWEWIKSGYTLRLEGYLKNYRDLVREINTGYNPNQYPILDPNLRIDNSGFGYAKGAELFWRDKKSIENFDYWISYSFIDTKRLYSDFLSEVTPSFVSRNNLNVVAKYFVTKWQTNFSFTYTYGSGRPYYDPASKGFLNEHTPPYQNLSLAFGHLARIKNWFTVVYLGINNVTNYHNIFGYRYSSDGSRKYPVLPALYRSVVLGFNFSLSQFNKNEL
jgi:hypothetical protein